MATIENLHLRILRNAEAALNPRIDSDDQEVLLETMVYRLKSGLREADVELTPQNEMGMERYAPAYPRNPVRNNDIRGLIALREDGFLLSHPRREMAPAQELAFLLHISGHLAWEHLVEDKKAWIVEPNRLRTLIAGRLFGTNISIKHEAQAEAWARARVIAAQRRAAIPPEHYMALHQVQRELAFQSPIPDLFVNLLG